MVLDVPQQVGQEDQKRDRAPCPEPRRAQPPALARQHQPCHNAEAEDQHRVLVLQPDTRHYAEPQPELRVPGPDDPYHQVRAAHPEQRLESIHRKEVVQRQNAWRQHQTQRRQALRKPRAAQFAGDHARKHYGARAGQGRGKPDGR